MEKYEPTHLGMQQGTIKRSLVALSISQIMVGAPLLAAVINVDPPGAANGCTLIAAVNSANNNNSTTVCEDGSGADTINLPANTTFSLSGGIAGGVTGLSGLPVVSSEITINGNNSTIKRSASATGDFRLIEVENGDLTLNNITLSGGQIINYGGGGIRARNSTVNLSGTTVSNNIAYRGGGIHADDGSNVSIPLSTIGGNYAANGGGGVYLIASSISLYASTISGNTTVGSGGGIEAHNSSVSLYGGIISANSSGGSGGGINAESSSLDISLSTASNNKAGTTGGGIQSEMGILKLINSTVSTNTAKAKGGGVYVSTGGNTVTMLNSTLFGNSVVPSGIIIPIDSGGGLWTDASAVLTLSNTVIANSAPRDCGGLKPGVGVNNWFQDTTCAGLLQARGDPKLGPLQSNGGPTKTHGPLPGSGLEGAGNGFVCQVAPVSNQDQRVETRNNPCFIGAVDDIIEPTTFFTVPLPGDKAVVFGL